MTLRADAQNKQNHLHETGRPVQYGLSVPMHKNHNILHRKIYGDSEQTMIKHQAISYKTLNLHLDKKHREEKHIRRK